MKSPNFASSIASLSGDGSKIDTMIAAKPVSIDDLDAFPPLFSTAKPLHSDHTTGTTKLENIESVCHENVPETQNKSLQASEFVSYRSVAAVVAGTDCGDNENAKTNKSEAIIPVEKIRIPKVIVSKLSIELTGQVYYLVNDGDGNPFLEDKDVIESTYGNLLKQYRAKIRANRRF